MELKHEEVLWNLDVEYEYTDEVLTIYGMISSTDIPIERWNNGTEAGLELLVIELMHR